MLGISENICWISLQHRAKTSHALYCQWWQEFDKTGVPVEENSNIFTLFRACVPFLPCLFADDEQKSPQSDKISAVDHVLLEADSGCTELQVHLLISNTFERMPTKLCQACTLGSLQSYQFPFKGKSAVGPSHPLAPIVYFSGGGLGACGELTDQEGLGKMLQPQRCH